MTGDDPNAIILVAEGVEPPAPKKIEDHWCDHPAADSGAASLNGRYGTSWFCSDHSADGDLIIPRAR